MGAATAPVANPVTDASLGHPDLGKNGRIAPTRYPYAGTSESTSAKIAPNVECLYTAKLHCGVDKFSP